MARTAEEIQDSIDELRAARSAVLKGQSVEIGGRKLTRAGLGEIQMVLREEERALAAVNGTGAKPFRPSLNAGWT